MPESRRTPRQASKHTRRSVIAGAAAATALVASSRPSLAAPKIINWWYEGATPAQQAALDKNLTQPFNASQSDYKLVIEYRGAALPDQLLVALAGGQGPDIVLTNGPSWTQKFVTGNKLLNLNDFAQKFGWKDKLASIVLDLGTYDGKLIALPKTIETQALFYNQTLFKQKGWTPPKNLQEAETLADAMLKAGVQPFAAGNSGQRFANRHILGIFYNNYCGPDAVYKALRGDMPWNAPTFVEAVELLKSWWDKGYFGGQRYFSLNMNQSFAVLATGKAAMAMQGTWAFQWVPDTFEKTKQELGIAALPQLSPNAPYPIYVMGIGADLAINASSQVAEGCAMVLNRLIDYDFVEKMSQVWEGEWNIPFVKPAPPVQIADKVQAEAAKLRTGLNESMTNGRYGYAPWTFWPAKTDDYMKGGIEEVWLKQVTPKQFSDKLNETFQQEMKAGLVKKPPARS
jgi:raffinose/stachyose/melibiose transport system substrate-binding protein